MLDLTLGDLRREGFSAEVVSAIDALTRREGEDDGAFVRRAVSHPHARFVKQADLLDNLAQPRLANCADRERFSRKYADRLPILN